MDPVTMMIISGGLKAGEAAFNIAGQQAQYRAQKRATRMQQWQLMQNADMAMTKATFDQNRIYDQRDRVQEEQIGYFAGGNLDPTSGSPAVNSALTAMQAESDAMITAARGAGERADIYGQIAGLQSSLADKRGSLGWGVATQLLNTASSWMGLNSQFNRNSGGGMSGQTPRMPDMRSSGTEGLY